MSPRAEGIVTEPGATFLQGKTNSFGGKMVVRSPLSFTRTPSRSTPKFSVSKNAEYPRKAKTPSWFQITTDPEPRGDNVCCGALLQGLGGDGCWNSSVVFRNPPYPNSARNLMWCDYVLEPEF